MIGNQLRKKKSRFVFTAPNKDAKKDNYPSLNKLNPIWIKGLFFFKLFCVGSFCSAETWYQKRKPMGTGALMKDHEGHYYHFDKTTLAKKCNNHGSYIQCNEQ